MSDTQRLSLAPPDSAPPTHMSQWFTELPPRMLSGGWGWSDVCHHCLSSHKLHIHSCLHNCVKTYHINALLEPKYHNLSQTRLSECSEARGSSCVPRIYLALFPGGDIGNGQKETHSSRRR